MSKVKLFTDSDLDGVSCGIIAKLAFGDNVDIQYCSPRTINTAFTDFMINELYKDYDKVFITDLSISLELANMAEEKEIDISLFDHHKTAEHLNDFKWATINVCTKIDDNDTNDWKLSQFIKEDDGNYYYKHCGTSLFYEYLKDKFSRCANKVIKYFVELVREYDTWTWTYTKNQEAKNLADVFGILGIDDFVNEYTEIIRYQITERQFKFSIAEEHLILLKYKRKDIDDYINYKMDKVVKYLSTYGKVGVVICDRKDCTSELGNKMCNELDIEYAALIYDSGVALRSIGDFDVSVIAKANEGGGHKNAAGFSFDTIGSMKELKIIL